MHNNNYKTLLYFISLVIGFTLAIQLYWNFKNYRAGKNQLANEVQISVDNAIEAYYIDLAEKNTIGLEVPNNGQGIKDLRLDSLLRNMNIGRGTISSIDSLTHDQIESVKIITGNDLQVGTRFQTKGFSRTTFGGSRFRLDSTQDVLQLTSRIILAISTDTLDTQVLNGYIEDQLSAKNLDVRYAYLFSNDSGDTQVHNPDLIGEAALSTTAKSAYLPRNSRFKLYFTDVASIILKRNLVGILLSTVLLAAVVGCLFFLLKIINRQKQLAEVKNDLISNITHEFKTPISTVKVALEGIENFNTENDPAKTKDYLRMSHIHLDKLQLMVEKLLETATLDGDKIELKKDRVNILELLHELVEKHQKLAPEKSIAIHVSGSNPVITADAFHLENALNNVLDNAVKYGGDEITTTVSTVGGQLKIGISDNGTSLTKVEAEQLFEKFHRVPKGNMHNIKGFGIGLYYTKKIIEKHGGSIQLILNDSSTKFSISLPNE